MQATFDHASWKTRRNMPKLGKRHQLIIWQLNNICKLFKVDNVFFNVKFEKTQHIALSSRVDWEGYTLLRYTYKATDVYA